MEQSILKARLVYKNMSRYVRGPKSTTKDASQSSQSAQDGQSNNITLPAAKFRTFCFTFNNPAQKGWDVDTTRKRLIEKGAKTFVFQLEQGESGTPHYQGVVTFENPRSLNSMFHTFIDNNNKPIAHWEKCRDLSASIKYCTKQEGRLSEPVTHGVNYTKTVPTPTPAKSDLYNLLSRDAKMWHDRMAKEWKAIVYHASTSPKGMYGRESKPDQTVEELADEINDIVYAISTRELDIYDLLD